MPEKLELLTPVRPQPKSVVELHADRVVFNVISPDGQDVSGMELTLQKLIEKGDATALMMFGVMMQMNNLQQMVLESQRVATALDPLDPKFIEDKMAQLVPVVGNIMKQFGFIPPGTNLNPKDIG